LAEAKGGLLPRPLLEALVESRVLPLIGAGFSLNAKLPPGKEMPTWDGLGDMLSGEVRHLPPRSDPLEVISAYAAEHGRQALIARLRKALNDGEAQPGHAHLALALLPFDIVVTTNFDTLLEDSYARARRPVDTVIREDQLALQRSSAAITLVKAHGDLNNEPVLIATEEDYDEFLLRRPLLATYLANLLITRVGLLIGYSFSDRDWRELLAAVRSRLGRGSQTIYALTVDADPALAARFRRRGVKLIDLPTEGRSYEATLCRAFDEMRAHIARHTLDNSTVRDEGALEELRTTAPEERRLCLFLVPERRLAFYREQVFPLLRQSGVNPITPYDVDAHGATLYATAIALIEQVRAVLVDISGNDSGTAFEAGLALTADSSRRAALALVDDHPRPYSAAPNLNVITEPLDHPDFPARIRDWAVEILGVDGGHAPPTAAPAVADDPSWELLRAFRDLELALRRRYPHAPRTMMDLLEKAVDDKLLAPESANQLRADYRVRNKVLHEGYSADARQAEEIVRRIDEILERLG
jgi:SIR2-like protein